MCPADGQEHEVGEEHMRWKVVNHLGHGAWNFGRKRVGGFIAWSWVVRFPSVECLLCTCVPCKVIEPVCWSAKASSMDL